MRTMSLREPVVRALFASRAVVMGSSGVAILGRNWPNQVGPDTLKNQLGPVGIHVSRQGKAKEMNRMREVATGVMKLDNMGEFYAPFGRVVGSADVLNVVDGSGTPTQTVSIILATLLSEGIQVPRAFVNSWMLMSMQPDPKWWWVIAHPKPCKPVPWRGVMSSFPVPDEVFNART